MKKLISLILSMILVFSLIPVVASAASNSYKDYTLDHDSWFYVQNGVRTEVNDEATLRWLWANYCGEMERVLGHEPGKHKYSVRHNNKYHWLGCPCGCQISIPGASTSAISSSACSNSDGYHTGWARLSSR